MTRRVALMEAAHYAALLTESQRMDFILKNFGERIAQQYEVHVVPGDTIAEIERQPGENVSEKIVNFIATFDPTKKKIYTLWLVQRFLQDEVKLEDMAGITPLLEFFDRNKHRFEKKDIGQYKTILGLHQAVDAFHTAAPETQLRNDKDMRVLYDSPQLAIIQVKSMEGAIELGEGTIWCTAWTPEYRNRFQYYQNGPLIVIIDKAKRERWQFYFDQNALQGSRDASEFMDRGNKPVDLGAFLRQYPIVFKTLGEKLFVPYVNRIGLAMFRPETISAIPSDRLASYIDRYNDLMEVPEDKRNDREFALDMIGRAVYVMSEEDAKPTVAYYLKLFGSQDKFWPDALDHFPLLLEYLPKSFHTEERKINMLPALRSYGSFQVIPEPWPRAVTIKYWDLRAAQDSELHLKDVPPEYRSRYVIEQTLNRYPSDIPKNEDSLDASIAAALVSKNEHIFAYLPKSVVDKEVIAAYMPHLKKKREYSRGDSYAILARFPPKLWPPEIAKEIFRHSSDKVKFDDIPRELRTTENLTAWVKSNGLNYLQIPASGTSDLLFDIAMHAMGPGADRLVAKLTPETCSVERFCRWIDTAQQFHYFSIIADKLDKLPQYLKTPAVYQRFIAKTVLPIKLMPPSLRTPDAVLARVKFHPAEVDEIPSTMMNKTFAAQIVDANPWALEHIPDALLCEDVLYHWLRSREHIRYDYHGTGNKEKAEAMFARFPKSMWSPRTVELAIDQHFIDPDLTQIPEHLHDERTVASAIAKDASQMTHAHRTDEAGLIKAVENNATVIPKLTEEQQTEPVIYAALHRHAPGAAYNWEDALKQWDSYSKDYRKETRDALLSLNRNNWSRRCYEAAVGYILDLNRVPKKLRDDEMITKAVTRNPFQVAFLPHPAEWMNAHAELFENKRDDWKNGLEAAGVWKKGKTYVDVSEMERKPLSKGYSYVVVPAGPTNRRYYILNRAGDVIVRFFTERGDLKTPNRRDVKKHAGIVEEFAKTEPTLSQFEFDALNLIGLYRKNGHVLTAAELPREKQKPTDKLEWSDVKHGQGRMYRAYLRNKIVLELYEAMSRQAFGRGKIKLEEAKVLAKPVSTLWPMSGEIADYMKRHVDTGWSRTLYDIGISCGSRSDQEWSSFLKDKVTEVGSFEVWRDDRKIILMHREFGFLGQGKLLNSGKITNIKIDYRYQSGDQHNLEPQIKAAFEALQDKFPVK